MPNFEIREAKICDADEIGELIHMLAEKFITHEFNPKAKIRFLNSNDGSSVKENMESGFSYQVAVKKGKIVGVIGMKGESHLFHLFVAEHHLERGASRWCMRSCAQT